jgi:hypothetical protein
MAEAAVASIEVSEHEYLRLSAFEFLGGGSGYKCRVDAERGDFGCSRRGFYFDDLHLVIARLRVVHQTLRGEVEICQRYETEVLKFSATALGHFAISVELTDYVGCKLHLTLDVDQTYLPPFICALEEICVQLHV